MGCGPIYLVGQAPSRGGAAGFRGRSGRALAALMGIGQAEMLARFPAVNLLDSYPGPAAGGDRFPAAAAREAALAARETLPGRVLLVGLGVARAFGYGGLAPLEWHVRDGRRWAIVPHPSGRNRWYNDPANRALAASFLRGVAEAARADDATGPRGSGRTPRRGASGRCGTS